MSTYEIRVTQKVEGYYDGRIIIDALSKTEALDILKNMPKWQIDAFADWTYGDNYNGMIDSIEIDTNHVTKIT